MRSFMTKSKREYLQLQVGIFFTLGLVLVFLAIFLLGSRKGFFTEHYTVYCYFDDISGLRVGSPVQLAGIKVGLVSNISFEEVLVPGNNPQAGVKTAKNPSDPKSPLKPVVKVKTALELDSTYRNRVCTDSTASVVTEGLLGDRIIFLTVGCRKIESENGTAVQQPKPLKHNEILMQVSEPKGFASLVDQGDTLMHDAQALMKNTNDLVLNLNKTLQEINQGKGMAHKLIYDESVAQSLDHLQSASQRLEMSMQNLDSITQKIDEGQGTVGALINDPSLYNEVKLLLGKANRNKLVRSVVRYTLQTKEKDQLK